VDCEGAQLSGNNVVGLLWMGKVIKPVGNVWRFTKWSHMLAIDYMYVCITNPQRPGNDLWGRTRGN